MDDIKALTEIDYITVFLGVFVLLFAWKVAVLLKDWYFEKYGIETKKMKKEREDHEMCVANAKAIKDLMELHKKDNQISNEHDEKIREDLSLFMNEVMGDIRELKTKMSENFDNRTKDRQVSIEKEQRLNSRIDDLVDSSKQRDVSVEAISNGLDKLTKMFIDGQVNDMRHRILNFAASVSSGKKYNMEAYQYIMSIHSDYENILEEHNMTNGLVEESIGFIRSSYQEHLKKGDFGNYRL